MHGMEEQQLTFSEAHSPIATVEVIITDFDGNRHVIVLENTPQRVITAQIATRRVVDVPPAGFITLRPAKKIGCATATINLTGIVLENVTRQENPS